jgi:hypothetical protein
MKFDDIKINDNQEYNPGSTSHTNGINYALDISYFERHGTVGVYVMKEGHGGVIKEISKLLNDGKLPCSWSIKAHHADGWNIQFCAHPDAIELPISISSITDQLAQRYEAKAIGNAKMGTISKIKDRETVQKIINSVITAFGEVKLKLPKLSIEKEFIAESKTAPFVLRGTFSDQRDSALKFQFIIKKLEETQLLTKDVNNFKILKERVLANIPLTEEDKKLITHFTQEYFTEHERVSLAMQYLYSKGM